MVRRTSGLARAVGLLVLSGACAAAPTGPLREGEVRVAKLNTPGTVERGSYNVVFEGVEKQSTDIAFTSSCFTWVTINFSDGPYCFGAEENAASRTATARLITRNPNDYTLYGYLKYNYKGQERQSNTVRALLRVR
jgi:hypothetical protein